MIKRMILLLGCLAMLTGCLPTRTIDEIHLIQGAGYDYIDGEKFRGTLAFPSFGRGEKVSAVTPITFSTVAETILGVHGALQNESPKPLEGGRLLAMLFGEELARQGIFDLIDLFRRDPEFGNMIHLAVTEGEAKSLLEFQYKGQMTPPMYLSKLLEHNMKKNLPTTNLHTFKYSYYEKGMDPFLPLLELKGDHVKIAGLALFDDDRYVGKINQEQLFLFKLLNEDHGHGSYVVTMEAPEAEISILEVNSSATYKVTGTIDVPSLSVQIKLTGMINEWGELVDKKQNVTFVEKKTEQELEKKALNLVRQFQQKGIDPLGWGHRARTFLPGWSQEKWNDVYPNMPVEINVDVNLVQEGTAD